MKLIVLDRDGVINRESKDFIRTPDAWQPLPGSLDAIAALSRADWTIAVATNQSGVGRGYFSEAVLEEIHAKMRSAVTRGGGELGRVVYCPHLPGSGCPCRKPQPGLLNQLATIYSVPTGEMVVVGDSLRDIEAALAVGARAILVRTGNGQEHEAALPPGAEVADDLQAVARLLAEEAAS
ncbi:MAG: D-glycero-beta-D-manno-heptose 1,7-bisphosphate 7-phosphatase [Gammaproteobacteria bacterium]|nr:D-glycero-beta-D-manno-heptose 1,7-bisphosphate 7-phosphatase [Gammaproteobacteria bacterium]